VPGKRLATPGKKSKLRERSGAIAARGGLHEMHAIILLLVFPWLAFASLEAGWKLTDSENGVLIYEQKNKSVFLAFRAEGSVDDSLRVHSRLGGAS
jgi:hypothetical protein